MEELRYAGVVELATALRRRRVSAPELARAALDLLERVGRPLNAIASLLPERALAEAERADGRFAAARGSGGGSPPLLCGIPYGVKDLFSARGGPTTWGAHPFRDQVIDRDATVIAKLARAGGVLAAKLALVPLVGAGRPRWPASSLQGPPRNPYDRTRYSGGSSSGPAIAVAAGLLPYAIGSETGGSLTGPAAFCGLTTIRPTFGLVSRAGGLPASWTLDKMGPLARTAEECALVLAAISGRDPLDATTGRSFRPLEARAARAAARSARVGFDRAELRDAAQECATVFERAIAELGRLTAGVRPAALSRDLPYEATIGLVMDAEAADVHSERIESGQLEALVDGPQQARLRESLAITARDYLQAMRMRTLVAAEFHRLFGEVDVLVSLAQPGPAPALDAPGEQRRASTIPYIFRGAANLAGLPGVVFPCGAAPDGLPLGLHLVGPAWSEPLLLAIAAAYQRATKHHSRRPPVAA